MFKNTLILCTYLCLSFSNIFSQSIHDNFIVHVIPKCGVHLSGKLIRTLFQKRIKKGPITQERIDESIARNFIIRTTKSYDPSVIKLLKRNKFKSICVIRDPRDAFISFVMYMRTFEPGLKVRDFARVPDNFDQLSLDEQITALFTDPSWNYCKYYNKRIKWSQNQNSLLVKYEHLVGSQGGGDDGTQLNTLYKMLEYVNFPIDNEHVQTTADNLYNCWGSKDVEGKTFTHGQVSSWKNILNKSQKKMIKKSWGDLLIQLGYEEDYSW